MTGKDKKISKNIIYFLFSIFFFIGLFTFADYGIGIDDKWHRLNGFYWFNYILSFTELNDLKVLVNLL